MSSERCKSSFRNLLLSEKARAESIPELEVLADDVKAGHGAASAPVNPSQIHYLMSRGMNQEEAVLLLQRVFLSTLLEIRNKEVIAFLRDELTFTMSGDLMAIRDDFLFFSEKLMDVHLFILIMPQQLRNQR